MDERRQFHRHAVHVAISIDAEDRKDRAGITRDLGAGGLLFHSSSRFAVGDTVDLRFQIPRATEARATGKVVRVVRDPETNLFANITAVAFAHPVPELDAALI
jgi:hypothetical protein